MHLFTDQRAPSHPFSSVHMREEESNEMKKLNAIFIYLLLPNNRRARPVMVNYE